MPRGNLFERLRVVLVNTRNPLNIGAAARAMSNFGFERLRVVNPFELAFREARSAVGAAPLLAKAEEYKSVAEAVADCALVVGTSALSQRNPEVRVHKLAEGAALIRRRLASSRVALLFGSEKRGLTNEDLSHCHWLLHIPTHEAHRSMNLGQAVAVCLYELARSGRIMPHGKEVARAVAGDLERLTLELLEALRASGFLKTDSKSKTGRRSAALAEEKTRRLVRRISLTGADAQLLLGMLRQILWRLDIVQTKDSTT
jgi:tRNA/rRNA methyltransferase